MEGVELLLHLIPPTRDMRSRILEVFFSSLTPDIRDQLVIGAQQRAQVSCCSITNNCSLGI